MESMSARSFRIFKGRRFRKSRGGGLFEYERRQGAKMEISRLRVRKNLAAKEKRRVESAVQGKGARGRSCWSYQLITCGLHKPKGVTTNICLLASFPRARPFYSFHFDTSSSVFLKLPRIPAPLSLPLCLLRRIGGTLVDRENYPLLFVYFFPAKLSGVDTPDSCALLETVSSVFQSTVLHFQSEFLENTLRINTLPSLIK